MLKERIRALCKQQKISVTKLEETLGLGNGAIGKWDRFKPKTENLEKVADYFGVTTDFLLGREAPSEVELDHTYIDKAFALLEQMDEEQQKTAIRLLKALAEENKE